MIGRIVSPSAVPYGNFYDLRLPEIGIVGRGTNFPQLLENIRAWRVANGWPIGLGFSDSVEEQVCKFYPDECRMEGGILPSRQRRLGYQEVIAGTKALLQFKLSGSEPVPQEEANRRASICSSCPQNNHFLTPCGWLCGELKEIAIKLSGGRTTPYDDRLKSCMICGCYAAAAVHLPLDIQTKVLTDTQREQFKEAASQYGCWKGMDL